MRTDDAMDYLLLYFLGFLGAFPIAILARVWIGGFLGMAAILLCPILGFLFAYGAYENDKARRYHK